MFLRNRGFVCWHLNQVGICDKENGGVQPRALHCRYLPQFFIFHNAYNVKSEQTISCCKEYRNCIEEPLSISYSLDANLILTE